MMNAPQARILLFAVVAGISSIVFAQALGRGSPAMITGAIISQPIGHYEFCRKYPGECEIRSKPAPPPHVTDYGWSVVRETNGQANATIAARMDIEIYGREEV